MNTRYSQQNQVEESKTQEKKDTAHHLNQKSYQSEDEDDDDAIKTRSLRPRKIENYRDMLQDEVTLKTIKDEELEKKRMKHEDEDEEMYEGEIERASDDEDEEYGVNKRSAKKNKKKKVIDDESEGDDAESSEGEEEGDAELAPEEENVGGVKRKNKMASKKVA